MKGHLLNALLALLFSLLIWIAVGAQLSEERTVQIQFALRVGDEAAVKWGDVRATGELKVPMKVVLRGPREVVAQVTPDKVVGRRNLTENAALFKDLIERGRGAIPIRGDDISIPPQLEVVSTEPSELELIFEKVVVQSVQVQGRVTGEPAPGFVVKEVTTQPSYVLVRGPEVLIRQAPQPYPTEPVDVSRKTLGISIERGVVCPEGITTSARVQVEVEIVPKPERRAVRFQVRALQTVPEKQLMPGEVVFEAGEGERWVHEVTLEGPRDLLDQVQARVESGGVAGSELPLAFVRLDQLRIEPGEEQITENVEVEVVGLPQGVRVVPEATRKFKIAGKRRRG